MYLVKLFLLISCKKSTKRIEGGVRIFTVSKWETGFFSVMKCSYDLKSTLQIRSDYEIFMLCTVHIQKIAEGKCLKLKYVDNTSYIYSLMSEEPQVWGKVWWIIRPATKSKSPFKYVLPTIFHLYAILIIHHSFPQTWGSSLIRE